MTASFNWCRFIVMQYLLSNIASISAGHPFRGRIPESIEGDARVVQIRDINEYDQVIWNDLIHTNITGRKQPDWLQQGDILFSARGQRNRATLIDKTEINPASCQRSGFGGAGNLGFFLLTFRAIRQ